VSFRNVSLQVNFGPQALKPLPFKCRMVQEAATDDIEVRRHEPKKQYEVLFPVGCPDEGTFEWLDEFLEEHPDYVELSDRKLLQWACDSGLWRPKASVWKNSNDKPEFNFGLPVMDDLSVRRISTALAPTFPRNYVVMEVKQNLLASDRKVALSRFSAPHFKKVAKVVMGRPKEEFRSKVHAKLLQAKKEKADLEWKLQRNERMRKKEMERRQAQFAEQRRKHEEEKQRKIDEEKKRRADAEAAIQAALAAEAAKVAAAAAALATAAHKEPGSEDAQKDAALANDLGTNEGAEEEKADVDMGEPSVADGTAASTHDTAKGEEEEAQGQTNDEKTDTDTDKVKEDEKKDLDKLKEDEEEEQPEVKLSDEELAMDFLPPILQDLTTQELNRSFPSFSLPEDSEAFDEIQYEWQGEAESKDYLRKWILNRKLTVRIEDLQPGEWFQTKVAEWQALFEGWQKKQSEFLQKKSEEVEQEVKEGAENPEGEQEEQADAKDTDTDIFSIEDICDIGNGEPLFSGFAFEDWSLLSLRYELFLLAEAWKRDVDDPERVGIHENHITFYFHKYYRKQLNHKLYGKEFLSDLIDLVKDTLSIDKATGTLKVELADIAAQDNVNIFVKLTEENRRERQRRIDAGDETGRLKFAALEQAQHHAAQAAKHQATIAAERGANATSISPLDNSGLGGCCGGGYVGAKGSGKPSWRRDGNGGGKGGGRGGRGGYPGRGCWSLPPQTQAHQQHVQQQQHHQHQQPLQGTYPPRLPYIQNRRGAGKPS